MPIHSRVDWRLDSLVSERHKLVESGYFSRSLNAYGRAGQPCPRCEAAGLDGVIVREQFANRSSYRCSRCQRKPRRARV